MKQLRIYKCTYHPPLFVDDPNVIPDTFPLEDETRNGLLITARSPREFGWEPGERMWDMICPECLSANRKVKTPENLGEDRVLRVRKSTTQNKENFLSSLTCDFTIHEVSGCCEASEQD